MARKKMGDDIIATSRRFFNNVVCPLLQTHFPAESQQMTCGLFGYGSECLRMDDELSRDHHWGLRIDALLPDAIFRERAPSIRNKISAELPEQFEGIELRQGHVEGAGLAPESLEGFLRRTLGIERAPQSHAEWLYLPEVYIVQVINGEVWHDPSGRLSQIRDTLLAYYPDPVWHRRISHWCRYYSGMGLYALSRALQRNNMAYAHTAFARSIKWALELGFLLNRRYFPYDKWLYPFFKKLPELTDQMVPLIDEATSDDASWPRRLEILCTLSDILDAKMVAIGIIPAHPRFVGNESSSYRLLEHAYGAIVQQLPSDVKNHVPCWDQIYLEEFHTGYVDSISLKEWDHVLCLTPTED
ncbi:MAG: DUF4037 domain-containing protein [Candidatus Latescibacterota bacterium]|nr:DUF4037 domain-containing protein [Candidatus Latescibacterota bacterium]